MEELSPIAVAREFNVSASTVRRWESAGVLAPTRRLPGSGCRRYSRDAVNALKHSLANPATESSSTAA